MSSVEKESLEFVDVAPCLSSAMGVKDSTELVRFSLHPSSSSLLYTDSALGFCGDEGSLGNGRAAQLDADVELLCRQDDVDD